MRENGIDVGQDTPLCVSLLRWKKHFAILDGWQGAEDSKFLYITGHSFLYWKGRFSRFFTLFFKIIVLLKLCTVKRMGSQYKELLYECHLTLGTKTKWVSCFLFETQTLYVKKSLKLLEIDI